ncbi:L-serine ammonia-lyase, iron-sulfur-dependent, subunit alpha [Cloacibacillus sp. An23]|uniref:L-cysteine desulfidase family protein n=1 Tax=Cloacibacillus sp. An23 TaxID=1965591 RepID=UPI000B36FC4E|nr:L-serine ammonia-lyase, iron-sulfur-dependent, subunit alpha [Cloacibacillus sp. An23]OUO90960.1 hypothetical protein B5F39_13550 [Cloacibacillus sp. An23]
MKQIDYKNHLNILRHELQVALGCTEPIAIAYAGAKAREVLGKMPESCHIRCSGNIVKNVKGVTVPNSGGLRGMEVAAVLGIVGGDPNRELAVLEGVTDEDRALTRKLLSEKYCTCELVKGVENLYITAEVKAGGDSVSVEIQEQHNNITKIVKNGEVLFEKNESRETGVEQEGDPEKIDIRSIIEFADCVEMKDVEPILEPQIRYNKAISEEGLHGEWGVQAGKSLLARAKEPDIHIKARAAASAGSDARMAGCPLPVVINCGSGNQGITVTMPIVAYAEEYGADAELTYRALALANLLAVHQKKYIGRLSAYCGVVSAAAASACGVAYMLLRGRGADTEEVYGAVCRTVTNGICTIGGMVCDGAKSSCATKISVAVENALMAMDLAMEGHVFQPGEGLTMDGAEETIQAVGRMGREGMRETDIEILNIMLGH